MKKITLVLFAVFLIGGNIWAQDFGFGFGDEEETSFNTGNALSVSISGEASASIIGYISDFSDGPDHVRLGDIFSGKLNFAAGVSVADAFINLNIAPTESPISIDEAFVRAYFGNFEVEAGLRKLTWGKADALGPLDVINPLDYSELTDLSDIMKLKIPRPMAHLSYRIGNFSKIEGVFVPNFVPLRFAEEGRWRPSQMKQLDDQKELLKELKPVLESMGIDLPLPENIEDMLVKPDTSALDYAQGGIRFTTTIGSADIGAQYYYGRLTRPAVAMNFTPFQLPPPLSSMSVPVPSSINYIYNPYHQIGIDWAQVLFGLNIRAEFAVNITEDLAGDDGTVTNPHLAWSFGFDRNLFWNINFMVQCNETIRLMDSKVSHDPVQFPSMPGLPSFPDFYTDIEGGTDITSTQIIASLSKTFFRDQLELRAAVFWELESGDFMLVPSLTWTKDAVSVELSGGIFGGNAEGQFGQYKDNSFVKAALTYSF